MGDGTARRERRGHAQPPVSGRQGPSCAVDEKGWRAPRAPWPRRLRGREGAFRSAALAGACAFCASPARMAAATRKMAPLCVWLVRSPPPAPSATCWRWWGSRAGAAEPWVRWRCQPLDFFDQGNIVGAETSVEAERIGMILWRHGVLDVDQHARVMEQVRQGARFGQTAVDLGFLSRETLFVYIAKQSKRFFSPPSPSPMAPTTSSTASTRLAWSPATPPAPPAC